MKVTVRPLTPECGADDWLWHGAKSMYDKPGFAEAARNRPARPVVHLARRAD